MASSVPHQGKHCAPDHRTDLEESLTFLSSLLLGLTLGTPNIRLRRPRPPLRELLRQPGFVACSSIILAALVLVDLYWLARVEVPPGGVIFLVLLMLWPLFIFSSWRPEAS